MKIRNIVLVCIVVCTCWTTSCFAQQAGDKDKALLSGVARLYNRIPGNLEPEELIQKVNEVDQQVKLKIDSLSSEEMRTKANLLRYNGWLWRFGDCMTKTGDQQIRSVLTERIADLDLDTPDLELLSDVEIMNLLNGYFRVFMANASSLEKATYVLYNIKSEKVRNSYVLSALVAAFKKSGYTGDVQELLDDIELCSKTESTIQKARELRAKYYPVRAGELAPDFEMEDENGKLVKLSDFKGKAVFIDVWATWCGGCIAGLPAFMALSDQYKDRKDIVFLTISDDGIKAKARWLNFLKEKKYTGRMPHLIINDEKDQFKENYCITGIPRYILIDKEGKIVNAWHLGAKDELFSWAFTMELENMNRK